MKKFVVCCLLFVVCHHLFSQTNDAGLWTSATVEKKISQSFSANFTEALRLNENFSELGSFFSEFGIEKKLSKNFRASANYRFSNRRGVNDIYSSRHRYSADFVFRKKISKLLVNYRLRIQMQVKNYFLPLEKTFGNIPENYWRNKISLKYNFQKKYQPFVSGEVWYPLNNPKRKYFDNLRFIAGFQYEINKKNSLEIQYIFQKELNVKNPQKDYIFALSYDYVF